MRKPRSVPLDGVLLAEVQQRLALIAAKERELATLRDGLHWLLYQQTGIDLGKEDWTLDVSHWTLTKEC